MKKIISKIALFVIRTYQIILSPDHGFLKIFFRNPICRFHPTCSEYAKLAIEKFGPYKGTFLAIKRLSRCHPWGGSGVDFP